MQAKLLKVGDAPREQDNFQNCVYVEPYEFSKEDRYLAIENGKGKEYVFTRANDANVEPGMIKANLLLRKWAELAYKEYRVRPYREADRLPHQIQLKIKVGFQQASQKYKDEYDSGEISVEFKKAFKNHIFTPGQLLLFEFKRRALTLRIATISPESATNRPAIFGPESEVIFEKEEGSFIKLTGTNVIRKNRELIKPAFKFEDLGIGGLDEEFNAIFRRAFASRIFPLEIVEKLGVPHVKGLLLFGPPGTGKTLMARQIGKMLNAREPKIVSGPEVLSKMVGESEENVRKLFADAEKEYQEKGEESGLHIIILDELDAICKQRGSRSDNTGVGDSIVNQLLAKMDGVDQLNNILVIGMTNRKDMIDDALLRPGRLEVHMEVGLPDENGRQQILKIHTSKMRQNDILGSDVELKVLAEKTKNYSGAEIQGLVKAASSYALTRHTNPGTSGAGEISDPDYENMKVTMDDFSKALVEVPPAFGVSEGELKQCVQNDIIPFEKHIKTIIDDGKLSVGQVTQSSRTPLISILLHGLPGSGKTALAAQIALNSKFPFIKLISPETMVGLSESAKISAINNVFNDSYKSPLSAIVIDNIERLLDFVNIGPRFSNAVLQTLLVLIKKSPPEGHRLLILGTTSNKNIMKEMGVFKNFSRAVHVPNITTLNSLKCVTERFDLFNEREIERVMTRLEDKKLSIGVKKLLMIIELARQDENREDKFVHTIKLT